MADIAGRFQWSGIYSEFRPFIVGKVSVFRCVYNFQDSNHTVEVEVKADVKF